MSAEDSGLMREIMKNKHETVLYGRIDACVDGNFDSQVDFLRALVQHPSDNPPGDCARHAEHTAALLRTMGLEVECHPVPQADVHRVGMVSATVLIMRWRFGTGGPVIALNAHGDVVPPGEGWTHPPYGGEIVDGVMYGRGVAVSKSDFSTFVFAVRALLAEADIGTLCGSVEIHLTYDEEIGGLVGPAWLLRNGLSRPDMAICAGFTHDVMIAHNGCLQLAVTVHGTSAHAAWPETGEDALLAAIPLMQALYDERETYAAFPSDIPGIGCAKLTIGMISGGESVNVVPDRVQFRLDRRLLPHESPEAVEDRLRTVLASVPLGGCRVTVERILLARPLTPDERQVPLADALRDHGEVVLGQKPGAVGMPLFTDARLYAEAGCATVLYGAGPKRIEEARGHRADEQLVMSDLRAATKIVARALCDLLAA
ncbi:M20/M25/M40 family metallo-hydrolase [Acidomonas methanolica]|nr:M20/M25/M40 family metallo-hydrolase [Acidomonas methanolica]